MYRKEKYFSSNRLHYSVAAFLFLGIASCATTSDRDVEVKLAPTAEENTILGKSKMDEGDYVVAQAFFDAARNLDPKSQEAQFYAGIASVYRFDKQGAYERFRTVIQINQSSEYAKSARKWLKRLSNLLQVGVSVVGRVEGTHRRWSTGRSAPSLLADTLSRTGFFVASPLEDRRFRYSRDRISDICASARAQGVKVVLHVSTVRLDVAPAFSFFDIQTSSSRGTMRLLAASGLGAVQLFRARDCKPSGSFNERLNITVFGTEREVGNKGLVRLFQKIALRLIQETY